MAITTPQSYWKMDESSGNAVDVVGGFNGTNTGVTYSAGKINNGAVFDGATTTKLNLSTTAFAPTTAISFSCWVNCASYASRQALFTKSDGVGNTTSVFSFEVGNVSGKATMTLFSGSNITTTSTSSLTTSVWTHLVFTYDGTNMKIYINGSLDKTTAGSITMNSITMATALGFYGSYNLLTLNGKMDEVGFWSNYALTASEVTELYNGGSGLQYPFILNNSGFFYFM